MKNIRRAQRDVGKRGDGSYNKNNRIHKKKSLLQPIFDGSMGGANASDGTVSGSLLSISRDVPFLCGPLPISKTNLKAWLFRNTSKAEQYEIPYHPMEYCHILSSREVNQNAEVKRWKRAKEKYHIRREELRTLAYKHQSRQAMVDKDDRLVPIVDGIAQDDPPAGGGGRRGDAVAFANPNGNEQHRNQPLNAPIRNNRNVDVNVADNNGNNNINNNNNIPNIPPIGIFGGLFGPPELNEEEEAARRFMQNQENEAAQAIAAAVQKYRREGVPENEFEFIKVIPRVDERQNLTARRIAIAIFCVLAAFVCIMIQTIQLFDTTVGPEPIYDQLVPFLLNVRYFGPHVRDCGNLQRDKIIRWKAKDGFLGKEKQHEYDCGDGVLHIPPVRVLSLLDQEAKQLNKTLRDTYSPYIEGINATWFHECSLREETKSNCLREVQSAIGQDTCDVSSPSSCFRGVHDGIISQDEVLDLLDIAEWLVSNGHSHITIHNSTEIIQERMPLVMEKLEQLLYTYGVSHVKPVAFQMSANLPVDMMATNYEQQTAETRRLYKTLKESIANEWVAQIHSMNSWSMLSLKRPFRDSCVLLSDLQASDTFAYRTSVSLSDGGGKDFSGGGTLYVDNHESNTDPGRKIQRGVVIDSSRGRVIVSTGGEENLRCRLPMRSGVRVELHIWWDGAS